MKNRIAAATSLLALLDGLEAVVEHRDTFPGGGEAWVTIAAFNSIKVAEQYAKDASTDNKGKAYRVTQI